MADPHTDRRSRDDLASESLHSDEDIREYCRVALDFGWDAARRVLKLKSQGKIATGQDSKRR